MPHDKTYRRADEIATSDIVIYRSNSLVSIFNSIDIAYC